MNDDSEKIRVHATSEGRLYIDENEFFRNPKIRRMIEKMLNSSLYKEIKTTEAREREARARANG